MFVCLSILVSILLSNLIYLVSNLGIICFLTFSLLRDGPDASSPQLGVFSGNTALESAYSTSPKVLIRFHSDFSTGGFFILNFHGNVMHKSSFFVFYTHFLFYFSFVFYLVFSSYSSFFVLLYFFVRILLMFMEPVNHSFK